MNSFTINEDKVKELITKEKIEEAGIEFDDNSDDWINEIEVNSKGEISPSFNNFVLILRHDKKLDNIKYNVLSNSITVVGDIPWNHNKPGWSDIDFGSLLIYFSKVYKIYSPTKLKNALLAICGERLYHPIKEYFNSLPKWDEVDRIDTLLIDYLGAEDSLYTRVVTKKL